MQKINFKNLPDTSTPLNATNLNLMQDNIENALFSGNYNDLSNKPTIPTIENSLDCDSTTNGASIHAVKTLNTYSSSEIKIGVWTNGKPIYRKVINLGALPNATAKYTAHNISNLGTIVSLTGMAYNSTNKNRVILPYINSTVQYIVQMFANDTDIILVSGYDQSGFNECFAIIEYTKTTD